MYKGAIGEPEEMTVLRGPRTEPFPGAARVGELGGGEVVHFVHQQADGSPKRTLAVILGLGGRNMEVLKQSYCGPVHEKPFLSDRGLTPLEGGSADRWNRVNYTETTGVCVSTTPLSAERAR